MNPTDVNRALVAALTRGFLVVEETPTDPADDEMERLFNRFNEHCEGLRRNRVVVCLSAFGLWRTMIAFEGGPQSEMAYVRDAIIQTFIAYLGSEPRRDDPAAWFASTADKSKAEALAAALVAIDSQPRDPTFDMVHQVHVH